MKTINKFTIIAFCAILTSCAQVDSWLVKNTGLTSADAISLGVNAKDRVQITLKEYKAAKARNLPSGKEVVIVSPEPVVVPTENVDEPADKLSILDGISFLWNMF